MSGRPRLETLNRDNELVSIIFQHKGIKNAIGTQELVLALRKKGYTVRADFIHQLILKIINERHLPICGKCHSGYYWAKSKQDIKESIAELSAKIKGLQERIAFYESFIYE